jgi:hypothetical protein
MTQAWTENTRDDGVMVAGPMPLGGWMVLPGDGRPPILCCPHCGKPMETARAARLVADAVYPPPSQS